MATDIQSMINKATGGTSLGQSSVLSPVQNLATYNPKTTAPSTPLPVNTTIPGNKLSQNTVTVNPPIVSTTANTKLGATVASGVATQPPAPVVPAPAPKADPVADRLAEIAGLQKGKPADVEQIREDEGVFDKQAQAQNIKNEYDAKDRYYEKKKRDIEKNAQGMLSGGLQAQLDNLDRERNQELADIAIRYNAANGDYKVAFDIAQAKIDAKYEPLKDEIDTLKSQFIMRQDDLTASEKLAAQEAINRREAEYNFQKDKELVAYKAQFDEGQKSISTIKLTPEDNRILTGAGFSLADINDLPKAVQDFGIDKVMAELTDERKKTALKTIYGIKEEEKQFLTTDYIESLFTDDQLKTAADEAGYRKMFSSWTTEKKNYLDSILKTIELKRKSGMTDKEILKEMQ